MGREETTASLLGQVVCGDCLQILPTIDDESVALTVFSPPYDAIRTFGGHYRYDALELGRQLFRVTVDGGVAAVVTQDQTKDFKKSVSSFRLAVGWVDVVGWSLFETVIYKREGVPGGHWKERFRVDHEYIMVFFKGRRPRAFRKDHLLVSTKHGGVKRNATRRQTDGSLKPLKMVVPYYKCRGTVWEYSKGFQGQAHLKFQHPATFPDKLAADLVLCFSKPGDIVLDPMCGSGTTCVQAKTYGRRFIGIDIVPEYCQLARTLLERVPDRGLPGFEDV